MGKGAGDIIVLSVVEDAHIAFVQKHLAEEMIVIDPAAMVKGVELSYGFSGKTSTLQYGDTKIGKVRSVWRRKPLVIERVQLKVPASHLEYAYTSIKSHHVDIFSLFEDAFWVSDNFAIKRASSKPYQLKIAARLGFNIPDTLATSSPAAAAAFIGAHPVTIVKSMAAVFPVINGGGSFFPATKIMQGQHANLQGLSLAPAIFQQAVDAQADVRVTVVGNHVFAAIIEDSGDDSQVRDWRMGHSNNKNHFNEYELPARLKKLCVELVGELGLVYGAIDLVIDKKGKAWFLEINPNGQWAFIEEETALPIGKAIARLLAAPNNKN